ncbi:hypothetical protein PMAYCL1PPCAC_18956, partial [Pristionchus mayeri]
KDSSETVGDGEAEFFEVEFFVQEDFLFLFDQTVEGELFIALLIEGANPSTLQVDGGNEKGVGERAEVFGRYDFPHHS